MGPYEYVLVLASIVVGLAISDLLVSLKGLLRARARVTWDWAALAAAVAVLMVNIMIWWSLYAPSEKPTTIGAFVPVLVQLILLFLLTSAVLPDEVPAAGLSLRDYYAENRRFIWTLFALTLAWALGRSIVEAAIRDGRLAIGGRIPDLAVLAVMVSMIVVRARWWHGLVLALLILSGPVAWLSRSLG
ncbi:hypothetical protein [Sphingomonas sp.]|uniref:hypothetical protein n=1 Tax=Sphingomonas sp. TaxID=28214 RepID=UPI001B246369|nr:hypothetical protein [Sphingomonas sp.]MBO9714468.1 hypothetical protein [Sphingomonas sp.]